LKKNLKYERIWKVLLNLKKLLLGLSGVIFVFCLGLFSYSFFKDLIYTTDDFLNTKASPLASLSKEGEDIKSLDFNGVSLGYEMFKVDNASNLVLIENIDQKDTLELVRNNSCAKAINGSFYDTNNKPLGLFISGGEVKGKAIKSVLFDGFFGVSQKGDFFIKRDLIEEDLRLGIQSGPLLFEDGIMLSLKIKDDFPARRMVALETVKGDLYFLTVFEKQARFNGPKLQELPLVLKLIFEEQGIIIKNALNLDGGAASVFKKDDFYLEELKPIGSLFCY